jgi:hypothetical protein
MASRSLGQGSRQCATQLVGMSLTGMTLQVRVWGTLTAGWSAMGGALALWLCLEGSGALWLCQVQGP